MRFPDASSCLFFSRNYPIRSMYAIYIHIQLHLLICILNIGKHTWMVWARLSTHASVHRSKTKNTRLIQPTNLYMHPLMAGVSNLKYPTLSAALPAVTDPSCQRIQDVKGFLLDDISRRVSPYILQGGPLPVLNGVITSYNYSYIILINIA